MAIPERPKPTRVQRIVDGSGPLRVPELIFADGSCLVLATKRLLALAGQQMTIWTRSSGMAVGIKKCGIMVVGKDMQVLRKGPERYRISGDPTPIMDAYTYLGTLFRTDLDVTLSIADRFVKARKKVAGLNPFLRCETISMPVKAAVIKEAVIPRLLFGAEIYGMNSKVTGHIQGFLNQTLRLAVGLGPKSMVSSVALCREMELPPIHIMAAARRARALQKCSILKTWIMC